MPVSFQFCWMKHCVCVCMFVFVVNIFLKYIFGKGHSRSFFFPSFFFHSEVWKKGDDVGKMFIHNYVFSADWISIMRTFVNIILAVRRDISVTWSSMCSLIIFCNVPLDAFSKNGNKITSITSFSVVFAFFKLCFCFEFWAFVCVVDDNMKCCCGVLVLWFNFSFLMKCFGVLHVPPPPPTTPNYVVLLIWNHIEFML